MAVQRRDAPWTYEDLLALPEDGKRYEIIEGELFELTGPKFAHGVAVMNLILLLGPLVRSCGGIILTAAIDVFFRGAEPVQPDIVILLPGSAAKPTDRGIEGSPDIVIEILSPSNRVHDLLTKRALYERAGIREYWIGDPDARTLEVAAFANGRSTSRTFTGDETVVSSLLPDVPFPASAIFAGIDGAGAE